MAVLALVYDYAVLWLPVFNCKCPGMTLFCAEEVLSCLEHSPPENTRLKRDQGERKARISEIQNNIGSVWRFLTKW